MDDPKQLYQKGCDLLARREHSRYELQQKLARHTTNSDLILQLLDLLSDEGLQSDNRFAALYLHSRSQRGYGREHIRQQLLRRKIDGNIITAVFEACEIDWIQLASQVRIKRFGNDLPESPAECAKQSRFLVYRGFNSDQIRKITKPNPDTFIY